MPPRSLDVIAVLIGLRDGLDKEEAKHRPPPSPPPRTPRIVSDFSNGGLPE